MRDQYFALCCQFAGQVQTHVRFKRTCFLPLAFPIVCPLRLISVLEVICMREKSIHFMKHTKTLKVCWEHIFREFFYVIYENAGNK